MTQQITPITAARPTTTPSNLERRRLCPGSAKLEAQQPPDDSADARLGRLFHHYLTNKQLDRSFLSPEQRDLLNTSDILLEKVLHALEVGTDAEQFTEETITSSDKRLTGTPDQVFIWREITLVNDLKSGFAAVERAEMNLQLRGYAVLVADNYLSQKIYVSILQPRLFLPAERITVALYLQSDIDKARKQITDIIDKTEEKKAKLVAGETQCRYCRAKIVCPAFRKALALPIKKFKSELDLSKAAREAFIAQRLKKCSDDQLEAVIEACKLARFVYEPANDEGRERIRAGRFTKFYLGKESEERNIKNVSKAITLLSLSGILKREELLDICTLSLHQIEERYRARINGLTWNKAREKIDTVLANVIEREPRQPRILRKK